PLQHPSLTGKQGNIAQLGGEFLFGPVPVPLTHVISHQSSDIEVADLMEVADVK
ncbi:hypothetical protein JOM56_015652, partial [Amanita muscaria]